MVNGVELTQRPESISRYVQWWGWFSSSLTYSHIFQLENCTLALTEELGLTQSQADEKAMQYLSRVRIADQATKRPAQLSGGQQQRVAIAMCPLLGTRVNAFRRTYLGARPGNDLRGFRNDGKPRRGRYVSMICVTHELGFAREVAHRIIFMDEGALVEDRDPVGFFERPDNPRTKKFLSKILR